MMAIGYHTQSLAVAPPNAKRFLPFLLSLTLPVLPTCSTSSLHSSLSVLSSAWLAINRCPFDISLPTTYPRSGLPSLLNSTVYVYDRSAL